MSGEDDLAVEVLLHLKSLSNNLLLAENLHHEVSQFRKDTNEKITDIKDAIHEMRKDMKEMHSQFDVMDRTLLEFKNEMQPIIDFKQKIQQQIIRYSALAFMGLLFSMIGMNRMGVA